MLQEPAVIAKISDTKAASEVKLLESFYTMLQLEPAKAFYGKKHVDRANEALAIETLMISDKLFRYHSGLIRPPQLSFSQSCDLVFQTCAPGSGFSRSAPHRG